VRCKAFEVADVARGNERSSSEIGHRNDECVDRELGPGTGPPEELTGPHSCPRIDRVHNHPLPPQPREDPRVGSPATNDFRQYGGYRRDLSVAPAHRRDESPYAVASVRWAVSQRGDRFAVEDKH